MQPIFSHTKTYNFETVWSVCQTKLTRTVTDNGKWDLSDLLNNTYAKIYNPSEYVEVDKITVLFKGRVTSPNMFP